MSTTSTNGAKPNGFEGTRPRALEPCPSAEPLSWASTWKLRAGPQPAFGARTAFGVPRPRQTLLDGPNLSTVMTDLHARCFPLWDPEDPDGLARRIGVDVAGTLAQTLRRAGMAPGHVNLPSAAPSRAHVLSRYLVAEALAAAADDDGRVRASLLEARFGADVAQKLVAFIASLPAAPAVKQAEDAPFDIHLLDPEHAWRRRVPMSDPNAAFPALRRAICAEQDARHRAPAPLVDDVAERFGAPTEGVTTVVRQHMLSSVASAAARLGERVKLVGKGHSTSTEVMVGEANRREQAGSDLVLSVYDGNPRERLMHYDAVGDDGTDYTWYRLRKAVLEGALTRGTTAPMQHFQVIDEGGTALLELQEVVAKPEGPMEACLHTDNWYGFGDRETLLRSLSGVEGTRDGARQLQEKELSFPVVNMAESPAKLRLTAVLIGWSVVEEIERCLNDLREQGLSPSRRCLVSGFGSTGSYVARFLRELHYDVVVKDPSPAARARASAEGYPTVDKVPAEGLDVGFVVGCVGAEAIDAAELGALPTGTLLFSASSSTKEFPLTKRSGFQVDGFYETKSDARIRFAGKELQIGVPGVDRSHWHYRLHGGGKEHLLMGAGFPINLTGHPDPIEDVLVELIRALLVLGSHQARQLPPGTTGLVPLQDEGQRFIATRWMERVRALDPPLPPSVLQALERELDAVTRELA
jgi:hypothetical protein